MTALLPEKSITSFLNVDLDLRSDFDLGPLLAALQPSLMLLNEYAKPFAILEVATKQPKSIGEAIEAFVAAADGKATKIIIPSEIQGLAGLATALSEVLRPNENKTEA